MSPVALFFSFIIGLVFALIVSSFLNAGKIVIGWCVAVFALIFGIFYILIFQNEPINPKKGEYYSTQCQLIETNIDNGIFQSNTNKLKCGDVIENVTVSDYKEAIEAYKNSNVQMNKLN
ncbi:hypothetical protein N0398_13000 [Providencia rettgeri]|uniref:hypothetical protein n=1 Tax=Providencia sp. TYF_10 TaxID=3367190 RepID=UPI002275E03F|nr:hypothetical protein [Providencia rettgeri]